MKNKAKSHSGAKKRFRANANGKIISKSANQRHNLGNKAQAAKRRKRKARLTEDAAQKKLRRILGLRG